VVDRSTDHLIDIRIIFETSMQYLKLSLLTPPIKHAHHTEGPDQTQGGHLSNTSPREVQKNPRKKIRLARTKYQKSGGFANKSIGQIRSLAKTAAQLIRQENGFYQCFGWQNHRAGFLVLRASRIFFHGFFALRGGTCMIG